MEALDIFSYGFALPMGILTDLTWSWEEKEENIHFLLCWSTSQRHLMSCSMTMPAKPHKYCLNRKLALFLKVMPQLIQRNWNFIMLLYFVVYLTNKLWINFQVGSLMCFRIFRHKCDLLRYIENTIEFNTNHLFDHQIVMPFFCNFPQLFALVSGWIL